MPRHHWLRHCCNSPTTPPPHAPTCAHKQVTADDSSHHCPLNRTPLSSSCHCLHCALPPPFCSCCPCPSTVHCCHSSHIAASLVATAATPLPSHCCLSRPQQLRCCVVATSAMQRCIIATHSSRVCRGVANTVAMSLPSRPCHSSRNAALLSCVAMTQVCHCVITVVQCCLPVITTAAALPLQQRRCRRCHLAASAAAAATLLLRHQHHLCHGIAD